MRITNHDDASGRKLLLVKDSYGNAIAPFLAANYSEVHVADFRSFPGKLPAYCQENGITDVLFFNNVMSANTYSQIETMNGLFYRTRRASPRRGGPCHFPAGVFL